MIDKKKIQNGIKACFDRRIDDKVERGLMRDPLIAYIRGFDDAIDWFKKALWHDTSETPKEGEQILYTATEGGEIVDVKVTTTALYDFIPWNEVVRDFNISKWCYIEDLLPNK